MTESKKRYIFSRDDLKNLIHESITFFSERVKMYMEKGRAPMFSDRSRWIDEFIDTHIMEYPVDKLLNQIDEHISSFTGRSIDDIKEDLRNKQPTFDQEFAKVKEFIKLLEHNQK